MTFYIAPQIVQNFVKNVNIQKLVLKIIFYSLAKYAREIEIKFGIYVSAQEKTNMMTSVFFVKNMILIIFTLAVKD